MLANKPHINRLGTSYSPVNNLSVPEAAMRVNSVRFFHHIIKNGQWVVKKLDFSQGDKATIRTKVSGTGFGYLYASFDTPDATQVLAIKKVGAGFHDMEFIVPYPTLSNFRIGVSLTIPPGYSIDLLNKETQYKVRTNSLMLQQHQPMHESSGIGFAGFGALSDQDINDRPKGGADSGGNPYWDGNFDNFSYASHKYSGSRAAITSSANAPEAYGSYHGYYAHRASLMQAKFNDRDEFLGWDAMESNTKAGQYLSVPSGVPMCMVLQLFTTNKKGKDKGNKDPRKGSDPYWIHASNYQLRPDKFMFAHSSHYQYTGGSSPSSSTPRPTNKKKGVIHSVSRQPALTASKDGAVSWDDIATTMEWYNPSTGNWSMSHHPTHIPMTNEHGFTKVIFRVVRQLSPETDKDIIDQLSAAGINYNYESTKKAIPAVVRDELKNPPTDRAYILLGRPSDSDTIYQEGQDWYYAPKTKITLHCYFEYENHPKAGYTSSQSGSTKGDPKSGKVRIYGGNISVADVEKMARMNNPELLNAFYPNSGLVTGGKVYAIGRGLSTKTVTCLSTSQNLNPLTVPTIQVSNADGSQIGTTPAARIRPKQLILSTDLLDTSNTAGEAELQRHWQEKFGKPLDINFFKSAKLKDSVTDRPHMYSVRDPASGLYIEAPYQIMIFAIEPEYSGPAVFYETVTEEKEVTIEGVPRIEKKTKLVISKPTGKAYARGKGEPIFLNARTPFGYVRHQMIDVIEEVEQQVELLDQGLPPEDVLKVAELDNPPGDSTVVLAEQEVQDQYITDMKVIEERQDRASGSSPAPAAAAAAVVTRRLVRLRDILNPFPGHYVEEPVTRGEPVPRGALSPQGALSGFTNSRDFYVEDVTSKWNSQGSAGLGGIIDETVAPFIKSEIEDMYNSTKSFIGRNAQMAAYIALGGLATSMLINKAVKYPSKVNKHGKRLGKKWSGVKRRSLFRGTATRRRARQRR